MKDNKIQLCLDLYSLLDFIDIFSKINLKKNNNQEYQDKDKDVVFHLKSLINSYIEIKELMLKSV